jgi:transposase
MSQPLLVHPLTNQEQAALQRAEAQAHGLHQRNRCRIVLLSAQGQQVRQIARLLDVCPTTVRRAIHHFEHAGVGALREGRHSGRPAKLPP